MHALQRVTGTLCVGEVDQGVRLANLKQTQTNTRILWNRQSASGVQSAKVVHPQEATVNIQNHTVCTILADLQ